VVVPNAELFTKSVTVNTAFETRRWEYELSTTAPEPLPELKSTLVETVIKVDGVLSTPPPEALVVDLGDLSSGVVKIRLTWWTKSSRQHDLIASNDRVLIAIREALRRLASSRTRDPESRAA
jgi:small conductance mechanosensitive channel